MLFECWTRGLERNIKYTSNLVNLPALMFFAAVNLHDKKLESFAVRYLKKRKHPIASFLLGQISEQELLQGISSQPIMAIRQRCKFEFWIVVKCLHVGDDEGYCKHLKQCEDIQGKYLEFEYHLAVRELDRLGIR